MHSHPMPPRRLCALCVCVCVQGIGNEQRRLRCCGEQRAFSRSLGSATSPLPPSHSAQFSSHIFVFLIIGKFDYFLHYSKLAFSLEKNKSRALFLPSSTAATIISSPPPSFPSVLPFPNHIHTHACARHPLPPTHLFPWPRSMPLNASTLLLIISTTQLCQWLPSPTCAAFCPDGAAWPRTAASS